MIRTATRVVGCDFESAISAASDDEVGQLEPLFERLRQVFVEILAQFTALHEKQ
jgi:hypothetical protein